MSEEISQIKSSKAYDLVRELIISGEALPGSRLILVDLEKRLGLGRGPIREALMRLDKSGLVQLIPYKGAIVTPLPSFKEMEYIYDARVNIETKLALEAQQHATSKELVKLNKIVKKMHEEVPSDSSLFQMDREFHAALYRIAKMPHLQVIVDKMLDQAEFFLSAHYYGSQDKDSIRQQHTLIIEALSSKDTALLTQCMKENILLGLEMIRQKESFSHYSSGELQKK